MHLLFIISTQYGIFSWNILCITVENVKKKSEMAMIIWTIPIQLLL